MPQLSDLVYNWDIPTKTTSKTITLCDETLRDGLEGGVPRLPSLEEKLELLKLASDSGITDIMVGFPGQEIAYREALNLCQGVKAKGLTPRLGLLGRMVEGDIQAIERIRQKSGCAVVAHLFVPCSPIRRFVDQWDIHELEELIRFGVNLAHKLGLPVNFSPEDTSRSEPQTVEHLCRVAVGEGATEITVCDTVGCLTPSGTRKLIQHLRHFLDANNSPVRLDFHGHNDRGLALANSLAAIEAGADCIQGTMLGIGERSGNAALDLVMINLHLQGLWNQKFLIPLKQYCWELAQRCNLIIPDKYPVFGQHSFTTQMGVHASAILKAETYDNQDLAACIYSGVNPHLLGLNYDIQVGPFSGRANVKLLMRHWGVTLTDETIDQILTTARLENRVLSTSEILALAEA